MGLAILGPLRELDEVAYLRFASVYQSFDSLEDFETEIALLRAERDATGDEPEPGRPRPRRRCRRADRHRWHTATRRSRTEHQTATAALQCRTQTIDESAGDQGRGRHET